MPGSAARQSWCSSAGKVPAAHNVGWYYEPTILTNVTPEMEIEYERIREHLKQEARGAGGIGFIHPGMLTPRGSKA